MRIFNVKISYSSFRENIGIILSVPTFIGGFWQIMELARLDTSYVRFFSISQLIADGLLILFVMLIYSLSGSIVFLMNKDFLRKLFLNRSVDNTNEMADEKFILKDERHKSWKKPAWFVIIVITIIFIYFLNSFDSSDWKQIITYGDFLRPTNIFFILLILSGILLIVCAFVSSVFTVVGYKLNLHNRIFRKLLNNLRVFIPAICLLTIIKVPSLFHKAFLMPGNLKNKILILQKAKMNNPSSKSVEIAYFNDKFVFIEVNYANNTKQIEVMQFENLFLEK